MKGRRPLFASVFLPLIALLIAILFSANAGPSAVAASGAALDSSAADFQAGQLYGAEVAPLDDGAVRLLAVGLGGDWHSGVTSGLQARQQHASVYAAGHIYVFGGRDNDNKYLDTVYSSAVDPSSHANGPWQAQPPLPFGLAGSAAATLNGRIYVLGGFDGQDNNDGVYRTTVAADGSLARWTTESTRLPLALSGARAVVANGRIYLIAGLTGLDRTNRVFYSVPDANGALLSWTETTGLPAPFDHGVDGHVAVFVDGEIYVALGFAGNRAQSAVLHAPVNGDGSLGAWQAGASYQFALTGAAAVAYGNAQCGPSIFVIGGGAGQFSGAQTYVGASVLLGGGTRGPWFATSPLQEPRFNNSAVVSDDGWIYVVDGGSGIRTAVNSVRYAATSCATSGALTRSPSGNFTSRVIDIGSEQPLNDIALNTTVQAREPMSLALRYRSGGSADLSAVPWSSPLNAQQGISQTAAISLAGSSARYFQYRVDLGRGLDKFGSPVLNWVRLQYGDLPTDTPTLTATATEEPETVTPTGTQTPPLTATATTLPDTATPTATEPAPSATPTITATPEPSATLTPIIPPGDTATPTITPSATATIAPLGVNLVVESISLQPYGTYRPVVGQQAQIAVLLRNIGTQTVISGTHVEVDVYANSAAAPNDTTQSDGYGVTLDGIAPGGAVTVLVPYTPAASGSVSFYAWVNRPRYVGETNYADNLAGPVSACTYGADGQSFADVAPNGWAYGFVESLACQGAVSGYGDGTFKPSNNTTRGQFAKMVTLSTGWPLYTAGGPHFNDVSIYNVFYPYIETAYNKGVVSGYSCGAGCLEFRWATNITRGQLAKIVALAKDWPQQRPATPTFADVAPDNLFYSYIETVYAHGLVAGYECGPGCREFRPGADATRAQLAKMLYLAMATP